MRIDRCPFSAIGFWCLRPVWLAGGDVLEEKVCILLVYKGMYDIRIYVGFKGMDGWLCENADN
jgi:hypothetical protein